MSMLETLGDEKREVEINALLYEMSLDLSK